MGILSSLWRALGGAPAVENTEPFREAAGAKIDDDEDQWRSLTSDSKRDLSPLSQQRMADAALYLWDANLIANRIVELPLAYILGEGVKLVAAEAELQPVLDGFWDDPINQMDAKLPRKLRELSLFGEQVWPAFVNDVDGSVRIGYIAPDRIQEVIVDPDNPEQPVGLLVSRGSGLVALRYRVIINGPEEVFTQKTRRLRDTFNDGNVFYFTVNTLATTRRGRSDLRAPADWVDAYDQFLFGEIERYNFLRAFMWDVTLAGATPAQVEERARKITAPKPGSVRVHNDSEKWEAVTPDVKAGDTSEGARLFRNHVLGGATIPEHWFGGGGDVNRSTGESMGEPTFKTFSMRQRELKHMLESVGRFALRQHFIATKGIEPDWRESKVKVMAVFPEMIPSDTTKYAAALGQVATACVIAMDAGLLGEEAAANLLAMVAGRLGYEVDVKKELEAARGRSERLAEQDVFVGPNEEADVATSLA